MRCGYFEAGPQNAYRLAEQGPDQLLCGRLHRAGSDAVFRYTNLELKDRYELILAAFK